jgi:DNA-binding GntR family transcriptional regulator
MGQLDQFGSSAMPRATKRAAEYAFSGEDAVEVAEPASRAANKIVRSTTVELVTAAIRQQILAGRLAPGEALRQEALAEELGVSRIPIREAITRLQAEGMLNVIPHKGAYVCALSVEEVRETFDIRLRLEPWIFAEAIARITPAEIKKAERLVFEMDDTSASEWGHMNWTLHETLYLPSRREVTIATLKRLHDLTDRYFGFQVVNVPIRKQAHQEHMALVDACRKKAPKAGAQLLEEHLHTAADQIVSVVEKVLAR